MTSNETREFVGGMCERFKQDVKPFIDNGFFEIAGGQLEQIIQIMTPKLKEIQDLPSGINYLISIKQLYKQLAQNKKPSNRMMQEYNAYAAQVQMKRANRQNPQ
ncbi:MAG: hypothetical protein PHX96_04340, partial [Candidatus Nanoarchaeia archaeon]|nr:hypothetical protein [Candidatus Nanoarchaeia archaeon]